MSQTRRHIFPAHNRIKKRQDYLDARNSGHRFLTKHFFIHVIHNGSNVSRLGVTVSKKIGNAVVRNRLKRLLREFFRLNIESIPTGLDISIVARRKFLLPNLSVVADELKPLHGLVLDQEYHD